MWIGTAGKASANIEEYPELYGQYMFIVNGKRTFKVSKDARSRHVDALRKRVKTLSEHDTDRFRQERSVFFQGQDVQRQPNMEGQIT